MRYNCLSYVFYLQSTTNKYNMSSGVDSFLDDGSYVRVSSPKPGDIFVFVGLVVYSMASFRCPCCHSLSIWSHVGWREKTIKRPRCGTDIHVCKKAPIEQT